MSGARVRPAGVLFVCEGNVCRSPYAERVLRAGLADSPMAPLPIGSAGTRAVEGAPVDRHTAEALERIGIPASGHAARAVTAEELRGAGLVLAASRRQRAAVVRLHPPAVQTTFTMRQFGRLLRSTAPLPRDQVGGTAPEAVLWALVRTVRSLLPEERPPGDEDDVLDPYGRSRRFHRRAQEQMTPCLELLTRALRGR